jgi:hypothetical protein
MTRSKRFVKSKNGSVEVFFVKLRRWRSEKIQTGKQRAIRQICKDVDATWGNFIYGVVRKVYGRTQRIRTENGGISYIRNHTADKL